MSVAGAIVPFLGYRLIHLGSPHQKQDSAQIRQMMTKNDFTREIAVVLEIPLREAKTLLEVILDSMVRALRKGEHIELRGFGSFSTHELSARKGRNPRTGVQVAVPAKRVLHFKASHELKELVNGPSVPEGSTMQPTKK